MGKTRKHYKNNKGGKVIASGGYGCVFNPALKCEGATKREKNKISKLMTERHATQEYEEINIIKDKLDSIPNYEDYFLLYDATLCRPAKLTATDLADFNDKCSALPKDDITKTNINTKLDQVMTLNMPNGGLPVDDYIYTNGSFQKIYALHTKLIKLLKHGIIPMNKRHIYHCDIKDSNVLVDDSESELKTRLIDWGLSVEYEPSDEKFPKNWRNRPLQFNVPFSVVIFSDSFYEKYSKYLQDGGEVNQVSLKPFVIDYLNSWMTERGAGHYKFINEIMFKLYSNDFSSVSENSKPAFIETQITMPTIIDYIVDVLIHYTKFKENGDLNLREYLNEVFIKIVDIYGFINIYYPLLELLYNNYFSLNSEKLELYNQLAYIFKMYLYTPSHKPYNIKALFNDLKQLGNLLHIIITGKKKTTSSSSPLASGIKTRKNVSSKLFFKRKPFIKRFKNPIFLTLK
jgi:serine/threonine protein kinase